MVSLPPEIFATRYPRELSGGQQQRVGLARALAMNPSLFLMDEPFGALDPILRKQLQDEFITIKNEIGRTILFITHDIDEAFKLGDRIAIMDEGELIQVGTPEELIFHPKTDMVAHLVEANRKYRHIESFTVQDLMEPIPMKHFFKATTPVAEVVERILSDTIGSAIIMDGKYLRGTVRQQEILKNRKEGGILGDIATAPITVAPGDAVVPVLQEMKQKNATFALVVTTDGTISGMLSPDSVLFHII